MIKKTIALCAAFALIISTAGCVGVGFTSYNGKGGADIQGSGEIVSESFSCDELRSLTIKIPGELYYTVGEPGVRIELYENLKPHLVVSNNNGVTVIDSDRNISASGNQKVPKIYISAPSLEALNIEGLVNIKEMAAITSDTLKLTVDGVCNGTIDLAVKNLNVDISGVGNVILTGTADNATIDMSGVGSLKAFGLQTKVADVETSGVGGVEISCSEKLIAEVSGVGGIQYKGNPSVEPNIVGMGGLKKVD